MIKKKKIVEKIKEVEQPVVVENKPELQYEFYEKANLVIHCNKCNKITHICTQNEKGEVTPIVIEGSLDLTKLFGGPMPTDNYSRFPLFCDSCKTMLSIMFTPAEKNRNISEAEIVEELEEEKQSEPILDPESEPIIVEDII
jgi:hypothetical protein